MGGCDELREGCCEVSDVTDELSGRASGSTTSLREETLPRRFLTLFDLERLCLYIYVVSGRSNCTLGIRAAVEALRG